MSFQKQTNLLCLLQTKFGFNSFRPHQEKVCATLIEGKDVLLVMPTGAGKSLCYQLPGLARGRTTLVISPLLALIEDQVEKLKRIGLATERIHSGRKREESYHASQQYMSGGLDFLFIAPERLSVPSFMEMLKKKLPTLIAIDEAHCISQWGHDFRPDYRLLGERLIELRPCPMIALTATATPLVQNDIVQQLGLKEEMRSIHGFRRENIAIHVIELSLADRPLLALKILKQIGNLPAIIYTSTRKMAETFFNELKSYFKTGIYHAGMNPLEREENQQQFLSGKLDLIVATVAFGMGIDKPDIRTVLHAALPGSIEGYYQEIGRAGRDGKASQAILLQSFADHRTHQFFFEKDYPALPILKKIFLNLSEEKKPKELLKEWSNPTCLPEENEIFEKALEKLWIHRGATIDPEENVSRGPAESNTNWEKTYTNQRKHREHQLQQMIDFTQSSRCRMLSLVKHFGDQNDSGVACGTCDLCLPEGTQSFHKMRSLTQKEQKWVAQIMAILASCHYRAAGRLYEEIAGGNDLPRKNFEALLKSLFQFKWIHILDETFQKEGKTINYRKITLAPLGRNANATELAKLQLIDLVGMSSGAKNTKKSTSPPRRPPPSSERINALKLWRLSEAKKRGVPAFRILTDKVLITLCAELPTNESSLLKVKGMGPKLSKLYGNDLLKVLRGL